MNTEFTDQSAIYDTLANTGDLYREWQQYGLTPTFVTIVNKEVRNWHKSAKQPVIDTTVKQVIAYWRDNCTDYVMGADHDGTMIAFVAQLEPDNGSLVVTTDLTQAVRVPLATAQKFIFDNGLHRHNIFIASASGVRSLKPIDM